MPYAKARMWVFGIAIAINTGLFPMSLLLDAYDLATLNIVSALLCWLGWFRAVADLEEQKKDGQNGR